MPFTAAELDNIANSALAQYLDKGKVHAQNIQNKPMLEAFESSAKEALSGGNGLISLAVKQGKGTFSLAGYTHDDQVSYGNATPTKRINFTWKEHHMGWGLTHTELKHDGITVVENGADQSTSEKDGREEHALAGLLDEKLAEFDEDFMVSLDSLIHGDGTSDAKALAGIRAFILDNPASGSTGGLNRTTNTWWRNRAATTAASGAGTGFAPISSAPTNGGVLLQFLQTQERQLNRFAVGRRRSRKFAGSDFIGALETEIRANGGYAQYGWAGAGQNGTVDGAMPAMKFNGIEIVYDPTLDDLGLQKRMYDIDMSKLMLLYMKGERKKTANPARPYDRYVMYRGVTTTAAMVVKQLNTSAVWDIA